MLDILNSDVDLRNTLGVVLDGSCLMLALTEEEFESSNTSDSFMKIVNLTSTRQAH